MTAQRVVSSVGRALRLHRRCREFEPLTTHHFPCIRPLPPRSKSRASGALWQNRKTAVVAFGKLAAGADVIRQDQPTCRRGCAQRTAPSGGHRITIPTAAWRGSAAAGAVATGRIGRNNGKCRRGQQSQAEGCRKQTTLYRHIRSQLGLRVTQTTKTKEQGHHRKHTGETWARGGRAETHTPGSSG